MSGVVGYQDEIGRFGLRQVPEAPGIDVDHPSRMLYLRARMDDWRDDDVATFGGDTAGDCANAELVPRATRGCSLLPPAHASRGRCQGLPLLIESHHPPAADLPDRSDHEASSARK